MSRYFEYKCNSCDYQAERYSNVKRCPDCGGDLYRVHRANPLQVGPGYETYTDCEKALEYYKAASLQQGPGHWPKPKFIPKRVLVLKTVTGDLPPLMGETLSIPPGEYEVQCNPLGAVSVWAKTGLLGLRLNEFEVLEWTGNPAYEYVPE